MITTYNLILYIQCNLSITQPRYHPTTKPIIHRSPKMAGLQIKLRQPRVENLIRYSQLDDPAIDNRP